MAEALLAVDSQLDRKALARREKVTIVHGLGYDKLQGAVRRYWGTTPALKGFKVNDSIPGTRTRISDGSLLSGESCQNLTSRKSRGFSKLEHTCYP